MRGKKGPKGWQAEVTLFSRVRFEAADEAAERVMAKRRTGP